MAVDKRKRLNDVDDPRPEKKPKFLKPASSLRTRREEPAFQRGGASPLTPLEQKQIQVQATRDALFEQTTGQKVRNPEYEDEENEENEALEPAATPLKAKRRKTNKGERKNLESQPEESGVRIEGLSYKVGDRYWDRMLANRGIAACPWLYGSRSDCTDQSARHRPPPSQQPYGLCASHVGLEQGHRSLGSDHGSG